jgi:hypothetical protein
MFWLFSHSGIILLNCDTLFFLSFRITNFALAFEKDSEGEIAKGKVITGKDPF